MPRLVDTGRAAAPAQLERDRRPESFRRPRVFPPPHRTEQTIGAAEIGISTAYYIEFARFSADLRAIDRDRLQAQPICNLAATSNPLYLLRNVRVVARLQVFARAYACVYGRTRTHM
jgi:hypothetical protein